MGKRATASARARGAGNIRKAVYIAILLIVAASIAVPASCGGPPSGDRVAGTGTVKNIELEGGFYGIVGDDGQNYDPINLKPEFRQDGLRVRFEAKKRDDMASVRMWGTLIELTRIEKVQ